MARIPTHEEPLPPGALLQLASGGAEDGVHERETTFRQAFSKLFEDHFARIFRYFDRLSGDPDLASDLAQEAFVRLYRRGALPDAPEAWLITVAMNLFRNRATGTRRRKELLTIVPADRFQGDPPPSPLAAAEADETRKRVRFALDSLDARERDLLLLRSEGYSYRDLAAALDLNEASVGTLLARARERFQQAYGELSHAS